MTTHSNSQECSQIEDELPAEHRRIVAIAAEYTKIHPVVTILIVTIAAATEVEDSFSCAVGILGETEERSRFTVPAGIKRDELFGLFDDASGNITTAETVPVADDEEWDW